MTLYVTVSKCMCGSVHTYVMVCVYECMHLIVCMGRCICVCVHMSMCVVAHSLLVCLRLCTCNCKGTGVCSPGFVCLCAHNVYAYVTVCAIVLQVWVCMCVKGCECMYLEVTELCVTMCAPTRLYS